MTDQAMKIAHGGCLRRESELLAEIESVRYLKQVAEEGLLKAHDEIASLKRERDLALHQREIYRGMAYKYFTQARILGEGKPATAQEDLNAIDAEAKRIAEGKN